MILVRDVFHLKYGKAKEAVALWKKAVNLMNKQSTGNYRIMTDLVGTYYTIVLEGTYNSLSDFDKENKGHSSTQEWEAIYAQIVPLINDGYRDIWTVVD